MKEMIVWLRFTLIRWHERRLPVPVLYGILRVYALLHAALKKAPPAMTLPASLGPTKVVNYTRFDRATIYLNTKLEVFPDRFNTPDWKKRWRVNGLHHLEEARRQKRPVILATCHFGPYVLMRTLLRASGIPAMALVAGKVEERSKWNRLIDRVTPFPEIRPSFHLNELRDAARSVAEGHTLFVVLDQHAEKTLPVPLADGWVFNMASGAIRLAARHNAVLLSCCIMNEGGWKFRMEIGRPVPGELLRTEADWPRAGRHLLDELLPHFREHPKQCMPQLVRRFQRPANTAGGASSRDVAAVGERNVT